MQDQSTGGNTTLQQQQSNLQQSTPNLQQSGTPTSTYDVSGVLSENAPSGQLQVSTVPGTSSTVQPDRTIANAGVNHWILPLLVAVTLVVAYAAYLVIRRTNEQLAVEIPEEPITPKPEPVLNPKPKKTTKAKKKSQKHRKSGRR